MRLFVGLRPPLQIREQLMSAMEGVADARWQDDAQLHITLRFIGEVEPPQADDPARASRSVTVAPPTLRIDRVGAFRTRGRARALWAGVTPNELLTALHQKIDQTLVRVGLAPEGRAYLPHITMARFWSTGGATDRWLADYAGLTSAPFTPDHFLLYESHLGRNGAVYEAIAHYPLH